MIWLVMALITILMLSGYAAYLWWQVLSNKKQKRLALEKAKSEQDAAELKHQSYLQTSLHVIAMSAINGDLNVSEGCIRIKVLLDNLDFDAYTGEINKEKLAIIDDVYEQLQNFDTHQARKELSEVERKKQDRKRHFIEVKNQDALYEAFLIISENFKIIPE